MTRRSRIVSIALAAALLAIPIAAGWWGHSKAVRSAEQVIRSLGYTRIYLCGFDWGSLGEHFVATGPLGRIRGASWCAPAGCFVRIDTQPLRVYDMRMDMRCKRGSGCVFTPDPNAGIPGKQHGTIIITTDHQRDPEALQRKLPPLPETLHQEGQ